MIYKTLLRSSTELTITSHRNSLNTQKETTIYDVGNPGTSLRQAHKCGVA